jgi:outer membrane protein assembly factor BamB
MKRITLCLLIGYLLSGSAFSAPVKGWLHWRGPEQNGTSRETGLPDKWELGGANDLWSLPMAGRGTPVIAGNRVYVWSYELPDTGLQEVLMCLDAATGKKIWEHKWSDYLSDIIYNRYTIGAPTVDAETGNVYAQGSAGQFFAFNADGKLLWEHAMLEEFGRLALPNGRTGAAVIDDDLVIVHGITGNWGREGPAANRFYAFDKKTGELVWRSTPGKSPPKDGVFGTPVLGWQNGKRVFYCGTGDGAVVCANARTGLPLWRFDLSAVAVNASVILLKDRVIAGHAEENLDSSETGRMVALRLGAEPEPKPGVEDPVVVDKSAEIWRNKENAHTSSGVVVGERYYQVNRVGELVAIDINNGTTIWKQKLGTEQLHASITYADGKLFVPLKDEGLYIVKPREKDGQILSHTKLEGECLGAPAIWNGKIYLLTTEKLYCFGTKGDSQNLPPEPAAMTPPKPGPIAKIMVRPEEVLMRPGTKATFRFFGVDSNGLTVKELTGVKPTWKKFIPPTAKVRAEMDAAVNEQGEMVVAPGAKLSAGAWEVTIGDWKGYMRGRVVCGLPYYEDFEKFKPEEQQFADDNPAKRSFAWPPLPWIGARFRWEVKELDGNKVFAKTLDRILFQRAFTLIGDPKASNYTVEADVMTDGNRRMMSNIGLINQRYVINLVGNWQQIEIFSNQEHFKATAPFKWQSKVWYRLKTRVDINADGSGVVRAKAWPKGEPEPAAWTIEAPHKNAHKEGSPGIYGFSPQCQFAAYVDNVSVTPNQ